MRGSCVAVALSLLSASALAQAPTSTTTPSTTGSTPSTTSATPSTTSSTPATTTSATTSSTGSTTTTSSTPARSTTTSTQSSTPPRERALADDHDPDEAEEEEDSWGVFYIQALGGYSFANVVQFSQENFVPEATELDGSGLYGGLGLGFRLYWVTIGAQATLASYFGFELGTVGLDVALHLPIPVVQPYVRVGVGYAWMGDADYMDPMLSQTDVYGYAIDAGLGLDIKLARFLSLGAGFDAAFLNMTRQALTDGNVTGVEIQEEGDAVGLQVRVHAQLTFHI